jgi:hypothetical protein
VERLCYKHYTDEDRQAQDGTLPFFEFKGAIMRCVTSADIINLQATHAWPEAPLFLSLYIYIYIYIYSWLSVLVFHTLDYIEIEIQVLDLCSEASITIP